MLLALFLIDLAAGLYLFLPLVGRRNAGVKFYRLILITGGALAICALVPSQLAHSQTSSALEAIAVGLTIIVYVTLRYPKRLIFRVPAAEDQPLRITQRHVDDDRQSDRDRLKRAGRLRMRQL